MSKDPTETVRFRDRDGDEYVVRAVEGGLIQIEQDGNRMAEFYATDAHRIVDGITEAVRLTALSGQYPVSEPDL
ncbi:hypothetical protein SEA_EASTWEST_47 [Arthrobacter phage EastWest]|uniref:Uncharacterized protein n=1 Tax=Arthrobacter phage EastWest TaxID=2894292 RepID=A0AAE8YLM9_9CAUD|nr:hypothetical protein SEA_EASTWEST_47 [Arthrobacter phage EastWest]